MVTSSLLAVTHCRKVVFEDFVGKDNKTAFTDKLDSWLQARPVGPAPEVRRWPTTHRPLACQLPRAK